MTPQNSPDTLVARQDGFSVARMEFDKKKFKSTDDVTAFLTDKGYDTADLEIEDTDENFVVADTETAFVGELNQIRADELHEGLTLYIGELPKEAVVAPSAEDEITERVADAGGVVQPVAKSGDTPSGDAGSANIDEPSALHAEMTVKYDSFAAMFSPGRTFSEVAADATADGFPPAVYEATEIMYSAVRNNILAGDDEGVRRAATDFGSVVAELAKLFKAGSPDEQTERSEEDRKKVIDLLAPNLGNRMPLTKVTDDDDEDADAVVASTDENGEPIVEPIPDGDDVEITASADGKPKKKEGISDEDEAAALAAAEASAKDTDHGLESILTAVGGIAEEVAKITSAVSEVSLKVDETRAELDERVAGLEAERQKRQSADIDEDETESTETRKVKASDDPLRRGLLGINGHSQGF